jgi:hypothetical protein
MEKRKETLPSKIYYNPKHEASFGGLENFTAQQERQRTI